MSATDLTGQQHYDVVIVGAGMVGASLASALAHPASSKGPAVLLVEASPLVQDDTPLQPGFDLRSTVLSATTVDYFRELGIWSDLAPYSESILDIHVSDQGRFGTVRLDSASEGVPALGYVTENRALGRALNLGLFRSSSIELCAPVLVKSMQPCQQGMALQLTASGATGATAVITAALVVLAEGGRSGLPAQLGITTTTQSYGQSAVIANVAMTRPHHGRAWERFTAKGPLALLPLPDLQGQHRAALVWTHPDRDAQHYLQLAEPDFLAALQQDFGYRCGEFIKAGKRAAFPLALSVADEQIRPSLVLLGNVAHTLHPVAGQGFNLALRDTLALAHNILGSVATGTNPGEFARLQQYQQQVSQDQQLTIGFSDYMTRMFSSSGRVLTAVRHAGMACVDLLPPLRSVLSRQAMGMRQARVRL